MDIDLQALGLDKQEIAQLTPEIMDHIVWFNAEASLEEIDIEPPKINQDQQDNHKAEFFKDICDQYPDPIRLLLYAHFLELLLTPISNMQYLQFEKIAQNYTDILQNDGPVCDAFSARIIEGYYVYEDFTEDTEYNNPILYLLETNKNIAELNDFIALALRLPDYAIIFLYASFCRYDSQNLCADLLAPHDITIKNLKNCITRLAELLQIE